MLSLIRYTQKTDQKINGNHLPKKKAIVSSSSWKTVTRQFIAAGQPNSGIYQLHNLMTDRAGQQNEPIHHP